MPTWTTALSLALSSAALSLSVWTFQRQRTETAYADIDKAYADLLRLAIHEPRFRDPQITRGYYRLDPRDPFRLQYETYAYMMWNLMETIWDRQQDRHGQFHVSPTWIPVVVEENRLHYTWFKHNLRLFNPSFQQFVTRDLNDIALVPGRIADLDQVLRRMSEDFPPNERMDPDHVAVLMHRGQYQLLLARHRAFDEMIGYAFCFEPPGLPAIWLDYMAIDTRFQGAGYGTLLFNRLWQQRPQAQAILFEVEPVDAHDPVGRQEQERRIAFYQHLGAHLVTDAYQFPHVDGGRPMGLWAKLAPQVEMLPAEWIRAVVIAAFDTLHADVPHRDQILERVLPQIPDVYAAPRPHLVAVPPGPGPHHPASQHEG